MKAVVVHSPGVVGVGEIPEPVTGPYDVLCKTLAVSFCSGTDIHIIDNHPYFKVAYPTVLGHEGIGEVIACGPKVRYFSVGHRITRVTNRLPADCGYQLHFGAFAEWTIATDWQAMRDDGLEEALWKPYTIHRVLPPDMNPVHATLLITWRETHNFLSRINPGKRDTVLIIGSGANALAFADHAKESGAKTFVIGSPRRDKLFRAADIQGYIPYHEPEYAGLLKQHGCDAVNVIIDTIGTSENVNMVLPMLEDGGKIGVYGLDSILDYALNTSRIKGDFSYYNGEYYDEGVSHDQIMNRIKAGSLNPGHYICPESIFGLSQINEALQALRTRRFLKIVLQFG